MPTVIDTVKDSIRDLLAKVPNLPQLIEEVQQQPAKPPQETAYIYNGFDDLELKYLGVYTYTIPKGVVTAIPAKEHREVDQANSDGKNLVWTAMHLPGESIARELIETRKYAEKGVAVLLTPEVPPAVKEACDLKGDSFIMAEIEKFKVNREKAKAGIGGNKLRPDPNVIRWMRNHSPDDEFFASQSVRTSTAQAQNAAVDKLTTIVERLVDAQVSREKAEQRALTPPKRNPLESQDAYNARLAKWKQAFGVEE